MRIRGVAPGSRPPPVAIAGGARTEERPAPYFSVEDADTLLAVPEPHQDLVTIAGGCATRDYVTALTGAGISTGSGIPDFRGPNGLWTKNPDAEKSAQLEYYMSDMTCESARGRTG